MRYDISSDNIISNVYLHNLYVIGDSLFYTKMAFAIVMLKTRQFPKPWPANGRRISSRRFSPFEFSQRVKLETRVEKTGCSRRLPNLGLIIVTSCYLM